jgi:hypothetical protein
VVVCTTSSGSERVPGCSTESINSHVQGDGGSIQGRSAEERRNHRPTKNEYVTEDVVW